MEEDEKSWIDTEKELPNENGKYICLVKRNDEVKERIKFFKNGYWFGGCRPFSDNDKVLKWKYFK